jgi:hypothetical protein
MTVAALLIGFTLVGCSEDVSSTSVVTTATSTTTTLTPGAGTTSSTQPPDDDVTDPVLEALPDSFTIEFEERYLCDLGPRGFSDIHAFGNVTVETVRAPTDVTFHGRGVMEVEAAVQAGSVCSGSAAGGHSIEEIAGTVDYNDSGELEMQLFVNGIWYQTFVGEIVCSPGIPSPGAWEWPAESHSEYVFFAPIEHEALWEKEVSLGMCTGTITRRLDFESLPTSTTTAPSS